MTYHCECLQVSIPPVSQKPPVWHQGPTLLSDTEPFSNYTSSGVHSLPHIASITSLPQTITTWSQYQTCQPLPVPRPPVSSRPLSAGAARRNVQNLPAGPAGSSKSALYVTFPVGHSNPFKILTAVCDLLGNFMLSSLPLFTEQFSTDTICKEIQPAVDLKPQVGGDLETAG